MSEADSHGEIRKLEDDQLATFDEDYVRGEMLPDIFGLLEECFPGGQFAFLDVGGGNGHFADILLDRYPSSECTLLDNAEILLERNRPNPRKQLLLASVEELDQKLAGDRFDVVCLHWVLHHFVLGSYDETRELQRHVLQTVRGHLAEGGRISIFENLYDGRLVDGLTGRIVYALTSSSRLAPVVRRLGANTAGCGVCFLSERQWTEMFASCGLELLRTERYMPLEVSPLYRHALLARSIERCHFWLSLKPAPEAR